MTKKKQRVLLGAHMSIAGGLEKSILRGESIGCTTMQIFTKSNRQWKARPLTEDEIELFKQTARDGFIKPIVAHTSYLLNIGAANKEIHKKSTLSLKEELLRCEQLEIPYLVLHPGAHVGSTEKKCLTKIADTLDAVFSAISGKTMILLETMAGQGSNVGYTFEQLATIYQQSAYKKRLGICFDTCHVFAAGHPFSTEKEYDDLWNMFDEILGLNLLKVIHINDSKKELGSRVDRHEHIGKGTINLKAFELIMNDPRFFNIPKIIETPGKDKLQDDKKNMQALANLITPKNRKLLIINKLLYASK